MSGALGKAKDFTIDKPYVDAMSKLAEIKGKVEGMQLPKDMIQYKSFVSWFNDVVADLNSLKLDLSIVKVKEQLERDYEQEILQYETKEFDINNSYETLLRNRVKSLVDESKKRNAKKRESYNENNKVLLELEDKRKELEQYSETIIDLCERHGITTADVAINNESYSIEEFSNLYDEFIKYMKRSTKQENPITVVREKIPNVWVQGSILLVLLLVGFTRLFDVVAIVVFGLIVANQLKAKKKMKSYTILLGLVFNVNPLKMGIKDIEGDLESEMIDEDTDPRLDDIAESWERELQEFDDNHPKFALEQDRLELVSMTKELESDIEQKLNSFAETKRSIFLKTKALHEAATEQYEKMKAEVKKLGTVVNNRSVFNTKFRLGLRDECFDEIIDVGLKNIIIRPTENEERLRDFLQVLLANAFCNVAIDSLSVTVYDPNRFGQDLVPFYDDELSDLIEFKNEALEETIASLKEYAMENMKAMKGLNINEFNENAEFSKRIPKDYRLLIVLSQPKTIEENEALKEFLAYSANLGVFIWAVSDLTVENTFVFNEPFEGVRCPIEIDPMKFGPEVVSTLKEERKRNRVDILFWSDFIKNIVPEEEVWATSADTYVRFYPGYADGDPTQAKYFTLGNDGNVHGLMAGATGSGKSVALNQMIATITDMYSPKELELWLADYKGSEFAMYLASEAFPYTYPHIRTCLCTSDGDYAASVFDALCKEAEYRNGTVFRMAGVKNLVQYNAKMRADGTPEKCLPRIVFINDEFQHIYQKAEPDALSVVNRAITYISKIGRSAGTHLLFTSQSLKGTVSQDILGQFSLRFCLRAESEVSEALLGCNKASEIKQKRGFLYAKDMTTEISQMKKFKIPYIQEESKVKGELSELQQHIKDMYLLNEKRGYPKRDVIAYDESVVHGIDELKTFISANSDGMKEVTFVLGERMTYSSNKAPNNIVLTRANNQHIFSVFADTTDFVNFYHTIMTNIQMSKCKTKVFVNAQVKDLHYLCEVENDVTEDVLSLSTPTTSPSQIVKLISEVYEQRNKMNPEKLSPVFFVLLGWDKARGFGIDRDAMMVDQLVNTMQLCGELNIHLIFISTTATSTANRVMPACDYGICGRCDEASSYAVIGTKHGAKDYEKMKNGYMFIKTPTGRTRAKIYQSPINRTIESNEFVL